MFYDLKGYENHFIMQEVRKLDAKISVIPI